MFKLCYTLFELGSKESQRGFRQRAIFRVIIAFLKMPLVLIFFLFFSFFLLFLILIYLVLNLIMTKNNIKYISVIFLHRIDFIIHCRKITNKAINCSFFTFFFLSVSKDNQILGILEWQKTIFNYSFDLIIAVITNIKDNRLRNALWD